MGGQNVFVTVVAQIVNFLILGVLLKWVLWDRVLHALTARQQTVADRFNEAQRSQDEARELAESHREKLNAFEADREQRLGRLRDMDQASRAALAGAAGNPGEPVNVASAFDLPSSIRQQLTGALQEVMGQPVPMAFERTADVSCGIVLRTGSYKVAWSVEDYLDRLTRLVEQAVAR